MNRKSAASALAMMALAGCNLNRSDQRPSDAGVTPTVFNSNESRPGQVLQPNYCRVDTAILSRPMGDKVVESSLWDIANVQDIPIDLRQALESNGLRVGVITGSLPVDVLECFKQGPGKNETRWVNFAVPEGQHSPIDMGIQTESVTLLLNHNGKVDGRDYQDAGARLILTPNHHGPKGVLVRLVPQIHHGVSRRTIAPIQNPGPFAPHEFSIKDGQQEDILRELTTSIDIQPGQTVVIGCRPGQPRSLGTFMFTQPEPNSDRMLQSVLLIQATRNKVGETPSEFLGEPAEMPDLAVKPWPMPSNDSRSTLMPDAR
ncbi:hypothetical protein P12x_002100 [Tundrisphaera lichenicola]|uniref:hypothetical protein n=1 Tax=Tundrisphaera lichenicola TaxID=2029860 RepID=UPI003EBFBCE7